MALIELDLTARPQPPPPPPAHRYRLPGLLLAAVLVLALGGAAPGMPGLWRELTGVPVPIGGSDPPFQLTGGRLYTFEDTGAEWLITAWEPGDTVRRAWSTRLPIRLTGRDEISFGGTRAEAAGDVVLLSEGASTTVVDAATGRTRWQSPVRLTTLAGGRVGVAEYTHFRPGKLYDQQAGMPGPLYFSSTGVPHTEPPLRSEIRALDLSTGRTLWSAWAAGSVNVFPAPGDDPAVLILSSGRVERRDGDTGAVVRQTALARPGVAGAIGGELLSGRLMVYHGKESIKHEVAYAPDTLAELWSNRVPDSVGEQARCFDVLCSGSRAALDILDPVTGRPLWRAAGDTDLTRRAGYLLETDPRLDLPRRLADPVTGRTRVDLTGWRTDVSSAADEPLVLRRAQAANTTAFGVVRTGRDVLQPLGLADGPMYECAADRWHVVCRQLDRLRIWAYRS